MYEIRPYIGVGELQFDEKCDDICNLLGEDYQRINGIYTTGYKICYPNMNLEFDANDNFIAIEGNSNSGFCYQGFEIAGKPFNEVKKYFKKFDNELKMNSVGFTSYKLGIGVYVPTLKKSQKELVQGVIAFKKGYYGDCEPQ